MTLDEAIIHAEDISRSCDSPCGREHYKLAQWLKELKRFQWIPVSEALPSEGQVVLAIGKDSKTWDVGMFQGTAGWTDDERMWLWKKNAVKRVDYWMPKDAIPLPHKGV